MSNAYMNADEYAAAVREAAEHLLEAMNKGMSLSGVGVEQLLSGGVTLSAAIEKESARQRASQIENPEQPT